MSGFELCGLGISWGICCCSRARGDFLWREVGQAAVKNLGWIVRWQIYCSASTSQSKSCKKGRAGRSSTFDCKWTTSAYICSSWHPLKMCHTLYKPVYLQSCTHMKHLVSRTCQRLIFTTQTQSRRSWRSDSLCLFFSSFCWPPAPHIQAPHSQCCVNTDSRAQCELILLSGVPINYLSSCYCCSPQAQLWNRVKYSHTVWGVMHY